MLTTGELECVEETPFIGRLVDIIGIDRDTVRGQTAQGECTIKRKRNGNFIVWVVQRKATDRRNSTITTFNIDIEGRCSGSTRVLPEYVSGRGGAGHVERSHFSLDEVLETFQEGNGSKALRLIKQKIGDGKRMRGKAGDIMCEIVKKRVFGGYEVIVWKVDEKTERRKYRLYGDASGSPCEDLLPILEAMEVSASDEEVQISAPIGGIAKRIMRIVGIGGKRENP